MMIRDVIIRGVNRRCRYCGNDNVIAAERRRGPANSGAFRPTFDLCLGCRMAYRDGDLSFDADGEWAPTPPPANFDWRIVTPVDEN